MFHGLSPYPTTAAQAVLAVALPFGGKYVGNLLPKGFDLARFAKRVGFKDPLIIENAVAGVVGNKSTVGLYFSRFVNGELEIAITFVHGRGGESGALFALSSGLEAAARAEGATSLRIIAVNVEARFAETLAKMGFVAQKNALGELTGSWMKTIILD